MPAMVRKQFYIEQRQERQLKKLAKKTGMTEAAIIRRALDVQVHGLEEAEDRVQAWQEERAFIESWMKKGPVEGGGRKWRREDLYDRWERRHPS
ncbi:MAG: hypothetical protein HY236_16980 [Acidobacteria bacterium]|nr:hypothetical protein [Acidobacteriota bacterium]